MKTIDNINEVIEKEQTRSILIVSVHSKSLLEALCDIVYNKYSKDKGKLEKYSGIINRISKIKNKLICADTDLKKIQLSSSNSADHRRRDFSLMFSYLADNSSKLMLKLDLSKYKFSLDAEQTTYEIQRVIEQFAPYSLFNLIVLIDKTKIHVLHDSTYTFRTNSGLPWMRNQKPDEKDDIPIDQLLRICKLRKIHKRLDLYNNSV